MTKWRCWWLAASLTFTVSAVVPAGLSGQTPAPDAKKDETAKKPEPPPPDKPFAELIKGAKTVNGLFNLYETEDKVYLELRPEQFGKMYMVSLTCESGIGERGFYAAQVCGEMPVVFEKQAKNVRLLAKNTRFRASDSTAFHRAIDRSFSDSLLGATRIESLPHPDHKGVLIDLGGLLLTDFPMQAYMLEADVPHPISLRRQEQLFRHDQRIREERRDRHRDPLRGRAAATAAAVGSGRAGAADTCARRATCPTCAA